jgi:hypothetical protein
MNGTAGKVDHVSSLQDEVLAGFADFLLQKNAKAKITSSSKYVAITSIVPSNKFVANWKDIAKLNGFQPD